MKVLRLEQVSYRYEGSQKDVLQSINAEFEKGVLYTIIGKSGAGKSTLLALLSGLDIATQGTVFYNDVDMKKLDRDKYRAKSVGVIFQGYNLLTNATAIDNIVLAMNIAGNKESQSRKKEEGYHLLEKVGISKEQANRKVLKLSGGEQQRVGIARALSHDPDVIIADEPTGNLDSETETMVMSILQNLAHEEHKCVIIVTHSHGVSKYADELYGLNAGTLLAIR